MHPLLISEQMINECMCKNEGSNRKKTHFLNREKQMCILNKVPFFMNCVQDRATLVQNVSAKSFSKNTLLIS